MGSMPFKTLEPAPSPVLGTYCFAQCWKRGSFLPALSFILTQGHRRLLPSTFELPLGRLGRSAHQPQALVDTSSAARDPHVAPPPTVKEKHFTPPPQGEG